MPKPPAKFELFTLYKGEVQIRFLPNSHTYKVYDPKYKRNWEVSPSATGATDRMEKGKGLMVYAMSEAMKYMDLVFTNKSLRGMVDDENFTLTKMFQDARKAHLTKSGLGRSVGTSAHAYFEQLLKSFKTAQDKGTQWIVPATPMAFDLAAELKQSWENIISVYDFSSIKEVKKYQEVVNKDIEVRTAIWNEALMVQRSCEQARRFFFEAARQQALRVWDVERLVHSREMFMSGTFDAIIEFLKDFTWQGYTITAGVYIADFKTSNPGVDYPMGIFPNHLAQIGIYDVAYCEEFPEVKDRIKGHLLLGSPKTGVGFHPYVSLKRERNRQWAIALAPVNEYLHQAEKELKGLRLYGDK